MAEKYLSCCCQFAEESKFFQIKGRPVEEAWAETTVISHVRAGLSANGDRKHRHIINTMGLGTG